MPEVLLCSEHMRLSQLEKQYGLSTCGICGTNAKQKISSLYPYRPYLLDSQSPTRNIGILNSLGGPKDINNLINIADIVGPENVSNLAKIHQSLSKAKIYERTDNKNTEKEGLGHTIVDKAKDTAELTSGVIYKHVDGLQGAAEKYKALVMKWHDATLTKDRTLIANAKAAAKAAYDNLQRNYRNELKLLKTSSRNTQKLLTKFDQSEAWMKMRRFGKRFAKMHVADQIEASSIGRLAKHADTFGKGLVALNFLEDANKVRVAYNKGGNWEREMFKQSLSFTAGAGTAIVAEEVASALLLVATPVGWAGLLVGATVIVGTALASGYLTKEVSSHADEAYDWIMRHI